MKNTITFFYVGQFLELPTKLELTPKGVIELKSKGLLKTKKYKIIELYSDGDNERIVLEKGKNNHYDKYISTVKKIIEAI